MSNWISVKDRLPNKEGRYLVNIYLIEISKNHVRIEFFKKGMFCIIDVTHWQPLPTPPENEV